MGIEAVVLKPVLKWDKVLIEISKNIKDLNFILKKDNGKQDE